MSTATAQIWLWRHVRHIYRAIIPGVLTGRQAGQCVRVVFIKMQGNTDDCRASPCKAEANSHRNIEVKANAAQWSLWFQSSLQENKHSIQACTQEYTYQVGAILTSAVPCSVGLASWLQPLWEFNRAKVKSRDLEYRGRVPWVSNLKAEVAFDIGGKELT